MQSTSLAPELSATRSRDSCWITAPPLIGPGSLGPLQDLGDPPALQLGERPCLGQVDAAPHLELVVLVMGVETLGALHRLGVARVADPLDDRYHRRLVHG